MPAGILIATVSLTLVVLIFAEITPKTIAALHPEGVAFPASLLLTPLLKVMYPVVWLVSKITNGLLKLMGVDPETENRDTGSFRLLFFEREGGHGAAETQEVFDAALEIVTGWTG